MKAESRASITVIGTSVDIYASNEDAVAYVVRAAEIREELVSALKEARDTLRLSDALGGSPTLVTVIRALRLAGAA